MNAIVGLMVARLQHSKYHFDSEKAFSLLERFRWWRHRDLISFLGFHQMEKKDAFTSC